LKSVSKSRIEEDKMAAQMGGTPVLILKEGAQRIVGRDARRNNIMAARVIAEAVRSTLGPKGMDKMLVDSLGDVTITNDGKTILDEIDVEHPAAKMMVEIAKAVDNEAGDGTTSSVVLAGELLKQAEKLLDQDIHATGIVSGFRLAAEKAMEVLERISVPVAIEDEKTLRDIASTAMAGRIAGAERKRLSDITIRAVKRIAEKTDGGWTADIDYVTVQKQEGGGLGDSELVEGMIVDKEVVHPGMPKRVRDAKIALLNCELETKKTETDAEIRITSPEQMKAFLEEEEKMLKQKVDKIAESGANVVFCQKGIDDIVQHYLAKAGILAVRRVNESDMEKLAKATGGKVVINIEDLSAEDLGKAGLVEERKIADEEILFIRECKVPKAVGILLRGGTEHIVDEAERAVHDALSVVSAVVEDGKAIAGGGSTEIEIVKELRSYSSSVGGREALAINAFADALEVIPKTLAENAGLDQIDILVNLKAKHEGDGVYIGLDVASGELKDMIKAGVIEPLRVKKQVIKSAAETAEMILRIDDIISAKVPEKEKAPPTPPPPEEEETEF
jgi:thermosome